MNGGLIPNRYAKALYKFALEHDKTRPVYDEMLLLAHSFETNPNINKVLANPFVSSDDKRNIISTAAGNPDDNILDAFIRLILDNRREEFTYEMVLAYIKLYRDANDISSVKITTAIELPDSEIAKLRKLVETAFPGRKLEYTNSVNPDLIGGFVMDVDRVRMDASISSEIENLRQTLLSSK